MSIITGFALMVFQTLGVILETLLSLRKKGAI